MKKTKRGIRGLTITAVLFSCLAIILLVAALNTQRGDLGEALKLMQDKFVEAFTAVPKEASSYVYYGVIFFGFFMFLLTGAYCSRRKEHIGWLFGLLFLIISFIALLDAQMLCLYLPKMKEILEALKDSDALKAAAFGVHMFGSIALGFLGWFFMFICLTLVMRMAAKLAKARIMTPPEAVLTDSRAAALLAKKEEPEAKEEPSMIKALPPKPTPIKIVVLKTPADKSKSKARVETKPMTERPTVTLVVKREESPVKKVAPAAKPAARPAVRPEPKPVVKAEPKPVVKPEPKPVAKPVMKAPVKPIIRPEPKPVAKAAPAPSLPTETIAPVLHEYNVRKTPRSFAAKPASKSIAYHIAYRKDLDKWQVKLAGGTKAIKTFATQALAIAHVRELAKRQPGSIRLHGRDGKISSI